jgi:ABC-2 type transport system permease protein
MSIAASVSGRSLRSLAAASRLGWAITSNWTRPFIFLVYSLLRPISAALILVIMYRFISGGKPVTAYLAFLVTGTAFWAFVQGGIAGLADGITEDRGHYRMLKYVYTAPQHFYIYLVGRGAAQFGNALVSAFVVVLLATIAFKLPINLLRINYPLLLLACLIALVAVLAIATSFSMLLLASRDAYGYGDLAAGVLFIVSGAIFPIGALPGPLATIASFSPLAYWMEIIRRTLLNGEAIRMFPGLSDVEVLLRLVVTTAAVVLLAHLVFSWADLNARRKGLIDMETNF